jgi:hypothetical protein
MAADSFSGRAAACYFRKMSSLNEKHQMLDKYIKTGILVQMKIFFKKISIRTRPC